MQLHKEFTWEDMNYWQSGEWQVVQERLDDMDKAVELYCPKRELIFTALDETPLDRVKIVFMGQDPYIDRSLACGRAFGVPLGTNPIPPTLDNILKELENDLHYGEPPKRIDLVPWSKEGVLLWNVLPTCKRGESLSHDWYEYVPLTSDIIRALNNRGKIIFVMMGGVARRYAHIVNTDKNKLIELSHPVPRASLRSACPFTGSRIFSHCNDLLTSYKIEPVDWRL